MSLFVDTSVWSLALRRDAPAGGAEVGMLVRALESGEVESAKEDWGVAGLPQCRVEAMPMPVGDDAEASLRAVALLSR